MTKLYKGWRLLNPTTQKTDPASGTRVVVQVSDDLGPKQVYELNPRFDIRNHSPTGFNWGYGGSGPAQLALALCVDALGEKFGSIPRVYQDFKKEFVSKWRGAKWEITDQEIKEWALGIWALGIVESNG